MDAFTQHLQDICIGHAAIAKAGIEAGQREAAPLREALRTIIAAYDAAGSPPIPSAMLAAIEAARRVC